MFPDNLTRAETRARAALLETHHYQVHVDLSGANVAEPDREFVSTSTITFTAREPGRTHLDLIAIDVRTARLDGAPIDPGVFTGSRLLLSLTAGPHELEVTATCRYSRSGEGLHRFIDPADGRTYLYTQFEVAEARRMFACFEQPDLKARFAVRVLAPDSWTVVSNGRERDRRPTRPGLAEWTFTETPPISTYLTALVAGDYHGEQRTHLTAAGEVPMAVLCRASLAEHLDTGRILDTTIAGFAVYERHFGVPYPFGKYDQVFVPEYNGGAMENVGCVTFRDEYVFRSRATPATYLARDDTILHELAHMWFGDLVTMVWWDDLWLKESFATWASNFATAERSDPETAWASFANGFKTWAYRADQQPSTHPIAADAPDLEAVELNFDGVTYAKGASVLRQLVAFVGEPAFLAGARRYFSAHAYGNTTLADLLDDLAEASGRDLAEWSGQWLQTAGVSTVHPEITVGDDGRFTSFAVGQSAPAEHPTLRDHRMAIGLYTRDGGSLTRTTRVEADISGACTEITELVGARQPDLVLLNDDDLTYAKVRMDPRSLRTVLEGLPDIVSPLARAVCWAATWDMCRDAELPAADYVDLALRGLPAESDPTAVTSVLAQAASAARLYTPPRQRSAILRRWQDGVAAMLDGAAPGSDHQLALAKAFGLAAEDERGADRLAGWLAGEGPPEGVVLDPELRWSAVLNLARLGRMDEAEIAAEEARDPTVTGAEQAAAARAAQPTATAKAEAWRAATAEDRVSNGVHRAICSAFWLRGQEELLQPYGERYLAMAEDVSAGRGAWSTKGMGMRMAALRHLFPLPLDPSAFVNRLDAWLAGTQLDPFVMRIITERRDDAVRAARCQAAA